MIYKSPSHAVYLLNAHMVFTTKYRKKIFTKEHLQKLKEVFNSICWDFEATLIEFEGEKDHVHLTFMYPPKIALSRLINSLKGVSSRKLRQLFPQIKKIYYADKIALWSRSYFVCSVGGAPIEILKKYIQNQKSPEL